jgi:hypothetical protein
MIEIIKVFNLEFCEHSFTFVPTPTVGVLELSEWCCQPYHAITAMSVLLYFQTGS